MEWWIYSRLVSSLHLHIIALLSIVARFSSGLNPLLGHTKHLQYALTTRVKSLQFFECSLEWWIVILVSSLIFPSIRKIVTYLARSCDGRAAGARGNRLPSNCKPLTSLVGHGTRLLTLTLLYYHPPSIFFYTIFRLSPLLFSPC